MTVPSVYQVVVGGSVRKATPRSTPCSQFFGMALLPGGRSCPGARHDQSLYQNAFATMLRTREVRPCLVSWVSQPTGPRRIWGRLRGLAVPSLNLRNSRRQARRLRLIGAPAAPAIEQK